MNDVTGITPCSRHSEIKLVAGDQDVTLQIVLCGPLQARPRKAEHNATNCFASGLGEPQITARA
jgi:hypothetical protein